MPNTTSTPAAALGALADLLVNSAKRARVTRYFARVDEHLRDATRDDSLAFLRSELSKWQRRYEAFQADVFGGDPVTSDLTAWDFAETIAVLGTRIARLEREQVPA